MATKVQGAGNGGRKAMPDHAPDGSKHAVDRKQDRGSARRLIKDNDGDARKLADGKKPERQKSNPDRETDDDLDEALEQTFPASDPVSFQSTLVPGGSRR